MLGRARRDREPAADQILRTDGEACRRRGGLARPAARPDRRGRRADHARRDRAAPAGGRADPPGLPRLADRPGQPGAVPGPGRAALHSRPTTAAAWSACCSSTWTTSRSSTTPWATQPATSCWSPSPDGSPPRCAPTTRGAARRRRVRGRWSRTSRPGRDRGDRGADRRRARRADRRRRPALTQRRRSIGVATTPGGATAPPSCCARPTWRCTWPRAPARAAGGGTRPSCTWPCSTGWRCARRWTRRSPTSAVRAAVPADRGLCDGAAGRLRGAGALAASRRGAWCRRASSSTSPRRRGLIVPIGAWVLRQALRDRRPLAPEPRRGRRLRTSASTSRPGSSAHPASSNTVRAGAGRGAELPADVADAGDHREPAAARRRPGLARTCARCARSACASRSTTSAPATRR